MDPISLIVLGMCGLFGGLLTVESRRKAARDERVRQAYEGFVPPPVHGSRKFATDAQLKKAGLL